MSQPGDDVSGGKKHDILFIKCSCGRVRRWLLRSNTSIYGKERYSSTLPRLHALKPDGAPPPHVRVRTRTDVAHSATPSKRTHDTQPPLQTHSALSPRASERRGLRLHSVSY